MTYIISIRQLGNMHEGIIVST